MFLLRRVVYAFEKPKPNLGFLVQVYMRCIIFAHLPDSKVWTKRNWIYRPILPTLEVHLKNFKNIQEYNKNKFIYKKYNNYKV